MRNWTVTIAGVLVLITLLALGACGGETIVKPREREYRVAVSDGKLALDRDFFNVKQDDSLTYNFEADVAGTYRIYGYDIETDVTPGERARKQFVADTLGSFRITFRAEGTPEDDALEIATLIVEAR